MKYRTGSWSATVGLLITLWSASVSAQQARDTPPARGPYYLLTSQVDWVPLLPPPPAPNSVEQRADMQAVQDMQARYPKASARAQLAIDDSESSCYRFADVLGAAFNEKALPKTTEWLRKATFDAAGASGLLKNQWRRPRPYVVNSSINKLADMDPMFRKQKAEERKARDEAERSRSGASSSSSSAKPLTAEEEKKKEADEQKEIDNTSYPSGHATLGTMCGLLLARVLPEKHAELAARAEVYRESRMIIGAHFRTDIEGGRTLATVVMALISQNAGYQRDEAAARVELRSALGLPVELPVRKSRLEEERERDKAAR